MNTIIKNYRHVLNSGLVIQNTGPEHVQQLEELQKIVFPTLSADEHIRAVHYLRHIEVFPEGQFVITDNDHVIGMTTTMRTNFDFANYNHTFAETIAGGWLSNHNPNGDWLYGLDMGILPAYRGLGLARILYRARHEMAKNLGLKGQLTVGMMSGYGAVSNEISGEDYYEELIAGKRKDPTLTKQMKIGFEPIALMPEHLNDPVCGNFGVLIKLDIEKVI
ncbi:MAG: GNAT family N-acetyltransferase [Sphingobacteriales bacterium]